MKNIVIAIIVVVVIVAGAFYFINNNQSPSQQMPASQNMQNTQNIPNGQSSSVPTQQANNVTIKNFAFTPASLTVSKGTTVTWTNEDSATHTIKSATFNSGSLNTGDKFQFTFNEAGTFDYSCGIHPSMLGKIIVQ